MPQGNTLALVRETELARRVGELMMMRLVNGSLVQILPPRAVLFEEGAEPEFVHLVLSGRVGLVGSGGTTQEAVIEIFGSGSLLVVPVVILSLPYLVSGVVLAESRILLIRAELFRRALDAEPAHPRHVCQHQPRSALRSHPSGRPTIPRGRLNIGCAPGPLLRLVEVPLSHRQDAKLPVARGGQRTSTVLAFTGGWVTSPTPLRPSARALSDLPRC